MKNKKNLSPWVKYLYMLLSVLLAIFLWLIVMNTEDPVSSKRISGIPIEFINTNVFTDNNMTFEVEGNVQTATVSVEARRSNLNRISASDFTAVVDCNLINDLNGAASVVVTYNGQADLIQDFRVITDTVRIISESVSSKQLDVVVTPEGVLPEDYSVGTVTVDPATVQLSGPVSMLNTIYSVGATVDVEGAVEDVVTTVDLHYYDVRGQEIILGDMASEISVVKDGEPVESLNVTVEILAGTTVPLSFHITGTDQVAEGFIYDGYTAGFNEVSLQGDHDVVTTISSLDISADILDVTGADSDREVRIDLTEFLPENVRVDGESSVTVVMHVEQLQTTELVVPLENVGFTGARDGFSYSTTGTQDITLTLVGAQEAINEVSANTVSVSVDVTGLGEGIYSQPAQVTAPEGVTAQEVHVGIEVVNNSVSSGGQVAEDPGLTD